jgi:hypothetical protein
MVVVTIDGLRTLATALIGGMLLFEQLRQFGRKQVAALTDQARARDLLHLSKEQPSSAA